MRIHHLLSAALLGAVSLTAQASRVCQADFDNPTYDSAVSMGGPNLLLAIKTQATSTYAATRVEMFTGNGSGVNSVSLWSHDPVNNRPLAQLAIGSWNMMTIRGWQGANLTPPVFLTTGTDFWVVWGCINGSQASTAGNGAGAQPYRGSFDGGASWNGPFTSRQWKYRIWCDGPPGQHEVFGTSCSGATRIRPVLGWSGVPNLGSTFTLLLDRAPANSFAILAVGDSNTNYLGNPLPFSLAGLGAPGCSVQAAPVSTTFVPTDGVGQASVTLNMPNLALLFGLQFYDQWLVLDAGANALGLLATNGGAGIVGR